MAIYYNTNTLHINTGVANEDNIITSLRLAINEIGFKLNRTFKCPFKVNIIRIRDKISGKQKTVGYGYIWIGDPEIYWILAGHNPDGSERIEEYPDPNWSPSNISAADPIIKDSDDNLWADMIESEIAQQVPMIRKKLPPLITLSGYKYTEEQLKELKERADEFLSEGENIENIGDIGNFTITRAFVDPIPTGKIGHILYSRHVPHWIPNEVFKSIFSRYVSDPSTKIEISSNNDNQIDTVPLITRTGDTIYITYDPQTRDASFARIMQRKTRIQHPNESTKNVKLSLIILLKIIRIKYKCKYIVKILKILKL